jgi:hypothetical protein
VTGNLEVRTSIIIDPATGKAYVADVQKTFAKVEDAVTASGKKMGKSFDQVFSTGLIARLAIAGFALQRLASHADEPNRKFKEMQDSFGELQNELANTMQAAGGTILSGLRPAIKALAEARGEVHGLVLGLGGIVTVGPAVLRILSFAGISGGPVVAGMMVAMAALGTVIGAVGEAAKKHQGKVDEYIKQFKNKPIEEVNKSLRENLKLLDELQKKQTESKTSSTSMAQTGFYGVARSSSALDKQIADAEAQIAADRELIRLDNEQTEVYAKLNKLKAEVGTKTTQEFLAALNSEIAMGNKRLAQARDDVKTQKDLLEITQAKLEIKNQDHVADLINLGYESELKAIKKDGTEEAQLQLIVNKAYKQVTADIVALQSTRADLTTRIGQQSEKDRTEAYNRTVLEARLIDLMQLAGPVMELKAVKAERIKLETEGEGKAQTKILELRIKELELETAISEVLEQQIKAKAEAAAISQKAYDDAKKRGSEFSGQLEAGMQSATGTTPARPQQIRILQQELGITNLTTQALRDKAEAIELGQVLGVQTLEQAELERSKLIELTRLLSEERQQAMAGLIELQGILMGGVRSAADGVGQAFVDMFKSGENAGKNFGKFMEQLIQRLAAQLIGSAIFSLISNLLFPGSGLILGGGKIAGGGIFGGGGILNTGNYRPFDPASFPMPTVAGASGGLNPRWAQKIIASNERVVAAVEGLQKKGLPLHGKLEGKDIRFAYDRTTYEAKGKEL